MKIIKYLIITIFVLIAGYVAYYNNKLSSPYTEVVNETGIVVVNQNSNNSATIINQNNESKFEEKTFKLPASKDNDVSEEYIISMMLPKAWGKCETKLSGSDYTGQILYIESIGRLECLFPNDDMKFRENLWKGSLFKTDLLFEVYSEKQNDDEDYNPNEEEAYVFSGELKSKQLIPLKKIYESEMIPTYIRQQVEGKELSSGFDDGDDPHENISLWSVDAHTDYFDVTYIRSKDNFLRGMCYFSTVGQTLNFNVYYSCLLFNPEINLLFQISRPLKNSFLKDVYMQNQFHEMESYYNGNMSDMDFKNRVMLLKKYVISDQLNQATQDIIKEIKEISESISIIISR